MDIVMFCLSLGPGQQAVPEDTQWAQRATPLSLLCSIATTKVYGVFPIVTTGYEWPG